MGFLSNQETIFLVHWSALRVTTLDLTQSSGEVARGGRRNKEYGRTNSNVTRRYVKNLYSRQLVLKYLDFMNYVRTHYFNKVIDYFQVLHVNHLSRLTTKSSQ